MRILVVDDDELIADLIVQNLKMEGYETLVCHDGAAALEMAESGSPDLIVLDVMLPKVDGFHVCKKLQRKGIPIIMLTAKSDISDKLIGLEMGADDYMVKPFDSRELVARIRAVFRRLEQGARGEEVSGLRINEEKRQVLVAGRRLELTPTEFDLLALFHGSPGRVYTRTQLLDLVWGYDFLGDSRTVDIHIQRLRKKLGSFSGCIETVFGIGYRYREMENEAEN